MGSAFMGENKDREGGVDNDSPLFPVSSVCPEIVSLGAPTLSASEKFFST